MSERHRGRAPLGSEAEGEATKGGNNMVEERRKFERLNLLADVSYSKRVPSEQEKLSLAKNISSGGISIISYEPLQESDILDLKVYLPEDKEPVNVVGRVSWVKEFIVGDDKKGKRFDAGIEFIKISDKDKEKINKYTFNRA